MKLEFQLLVVDDNPGSIQQAIDILEDHLSTKGFSLKCRFATDLTDAGLRSLARQSGRDYNLVAIDYHLGLDDTDGAAAAKRMRRELQYTDMVFYSSDPNVKLLEELAKQEVAGVFIAQRQYLDDALKGLADTVIGKAVDLNHMRGIAMAEVAEMDVLMEEVLERAFASSNGELVEKGRRTLEKLLEGAEENLLRLRHLVDARQVLDVVTDNGLFSSAHRYMAINRVAKCLNKKPVEAIGVLTTYEPDIIHNRNTLAHAKEDVSADGTITLRAIKRGKDPVTIDEAWMVSFRGKLRDHRAALATVCNALNEHVAACAAAEVEQG